MSTLAYLGAIIAICIGLPLLAVIGVAICSHFDSEWFGGDDDDVHPL